MELTPELALLIVAATAVVTTGGNADVPLAELEHALEQLGPETRLQAMQICWDA